MNPTVPQISIIIITYNGRKFIKDLLTSLSQQSYPEERFEVIVVDNASEDDTVEMANKYAHDNMTVIQLDANYGFAGGNNTTLKYVKSEFVVFLNQHGVIVEFFT